MLNMGWEYMENSPAFKRCTRRRKIEQKIFDIPRPKISDQASLTNTPLLIGRAAPQMHRAVLNIPLRCSIGTYFEVIILDLKKRTLTHSLRAARSLESVHLPILMRDFLYL